jgi:hypothetical protein
MVSNEFQKVPVLHLEGIEYKKYIGPGAFIELTLLVVYNDGFCSLFYTTNLLKYGCLSSIGPSYDKNAKMGTSILIPEHCDIILYMCSHKGPINFIFWLRDNIDPPDAVAPAISAITNVSTSKRSPGMVYLFEMWNTR